ncbi:N/A [soil metagenome]
MSSEKTHGPRTVLIVDDDDDARFAATRIVRYFGYNVLEAPGGAEGIALFTENLGKVDAVVLDMMMPGLSGKEVAWELYKLSPTVPVILASGFIDTPQRQEKRAPNVAMFLQKPYAAAALIAAIKKLWAAEEA